MNWKMRHPSRLDGLGFEPRYQISVTNRTTSPAKKTAPCTRPIFCSNVSCLMVFPYLSFLSDGFSLLILSFQKFYPINYLRNVAMKEVQTSHLVFVDVDLVVNKGLYDMLKRYIKDYMLPRLNVVMSTVTLSTSVLVLIVMSSLI